MVLELVPPIYSNLAKFKAPNLLLENFSHVEEYMKGLIERRVQMVPVSPGSREEYKAEILNGMTDTWRLVLAQSQTKYSST